MHATSPRLPAELVESIILEAWSSPLSVDDRVNLMTTSMLVDTTWMAAFIRVSSKDVHIPCMSYFAQYFTIISQTSPTYAAHSQVIPDQRCQSITITVDYGDPFPNKVLPRMGIPATAQLLCNLMHICEFQYFPALRSICIIHENVEGYDFLDIYRLLRLPLHVTDLELSFRSLPETPLSAAERESFRPGAIALPSIHSVSFVGANEATVLHMLGYFPNLETMYSTAPLPTHIHIPSPSRNAAAFANMPHTMALSPSDSIWSRIGRSAPSRSAPAHAHTKAPSSGGCPTKIKTSSDSNPSALGIYSPSELWHAIWCGSIPHEIYDPDGVIRVVECRGVRAGVDPIEVGLVQKMKGKMMMVWGQLRRDTSRVNRGRYLFSTGLPLIT